MSSVLLPDDSTLLTGGSSGYRARGLSYTRDELRRSDLKPDPLAQFKTWLDEALRDGLREPYALSLATAKKSRAPAGSGPTRGCGCR